MDKEKFGAVLQALNPKIIVSKYKGFEVVDENDQSTTYMQTNVTKFSEEQQRAIAAAILEADKNKRSKQQISDVRFGTFNGTVSIEIRGGSQKEIDYDKFKTSLEKQRSNFKEVSVDEKRGMLSDIANTVAPVVEIPVVSNLGIGSNKGPRQKG